MISIVYGAPFVKILYLTDLARKISVVVETVTSETETETWLKFRDETRPRLCHKSRDRDLEVRDRDSRPHISMMVIKANSLNNAATKYLAHCHISR